MTAHVITIAPRLDEASVRAMAAELESPAAHEARVIVLEGTSEQFCTGMDFAAILEGDARTRLARFAQLLRLLMRAPRPTLAVIDGAALGGGLGLAAACDHVLATERARFGLPEALYGLAPAIIRPALRTRMSAQQLRLLVLSCHSRSAVEAQAIGLVDEIVPVADLDRARRAASRRLGRASTATVFACRRWDDEDLQQRLAEGIDETTTALATPAVIAALRAVIADEEPPWL